MKKDEKFFIFLIVFIANKKKLKKETHKGGWAAAKNRFGSLSLPSKELLPTLGNNRAIIAIPPKQFLTLFCFPRLETMTLLL